MSSSKADTAKSTLKDRWIYFPAPVSELFKHFEHQLTLHSDPKVFMKDFGATVTKHWMQND